jgi:hypothetical protein
LIWRGGRPFKHQRKYEEKKPEPKTNGANNDVIMISDSDDEAPTGKDAPYEDNATFEEDEAEYNPSEPYEPLLQTLDLPMGVEVLHLAFPHFPPNLHRSSLPTLLSKKLVCAVACSDLSIRVLSIPLTPPSPQSKTRPNLRNALSILSAGKSLFGEQMVVLSSGTTHQSISKGVSISTTASSPDEVDDVDMDDDDNNNKEVVLSRQASRSCSRSGVQDQIWDILVASHSADLSGLLLIHRIPLVEEGSSISKELNVPWRTQRLASPAVSVEFSSALHPAPRHSRLLIAEAKGVVRILDCLPKSRGAQGSWLLSLYPDFDTDSNAVPRRKPILDAKWVLDGKSILVLLADSKWGVWDIENGGPKPADVSRTPQDLTNFALDGWVADSLKSKPLPKSSSTKPDSRSKLAPMTPSTRKMRQDALFTGPASESDGPARGGLCVSPVHDASSSRPDDESVLLWHGTNVIVIPSLFTHWQNKVRRSGNLFGTGAKGEPKTISNIQLGGEACNEVELFPSAEDELSLNHTTNQAEILVTGERRLFIITPPLAEPPTPAAVTPPPLVSTVDKKRLAKGDLDTQGLDRVMADWSNGHGPESPTPKSRKSSHGSRRGLLIQ